MISRRLKNDGYSIIKLHCASAFDRRFCAHPYKRPQVPLITYRIGQNHFRFARKHRDWTFEEWKKVLWSDESPFELFALTNRQNDRIRSRNSNPIKPVIQVKFPTKIMVWDMMSFQALSELHIVPEKTTVNAV